MKLLAKILLIVAAAVLACAIWVLWGAGWEVWRQFVALDAMRTREFVNPVGSMIGGAAITLLAGVVCGYALGLPRNPKPPKEKAGEGKTPAGPDLR
ncbi:MAG: hypothetical protein R2719_06420 [Micropruina sp.]|nr:hypothetical protein [Micropruina sp.]